VATDYCVAATVRSVLSERLHVALGSDGHAPAAEGDPVAWLTRRQTLDNHNLVLGNAIHEPVCGRGALRVPTRDTRYSEGA
jgi:hypothetical protein